MGTPAGTTNWFTLATRIDEEPLPIQRDDLHLEWWRVRWQWLCGIEIMGSDPGHATQEHGHEEGDAPGDELDAAGIGPIWQIACSHVGCSKPPGEGKGRGDRRNNDGEHDGERVDQDHLLGNPNDPFRVEDGRLTCRQDDRRHQDSAARGSGVHRMKAPQGSDSVWRSARLAV
jgi:hypothetical protein